MRTVGSAASIIAILGLGSALVGGCSDDANCEDTSTCPQVGNQAGSGGSSGSGGSAGSGGSSGSSGGSSGSSTGGNAGASTGGSAGVSSGGSSGFDAGDAAGTGGQDGSVDGSTDGGSDSGPVCTGGQLDCNENPSDGCEVNPATNPDHCGGCGIACSSSGVATRACVAGFCKPTCAPGFSDCNGDGKDGCEININTNIANCGGCGRRCSLANAQSRTCSAGRCVAACNSGFGDCTRPAFPTADNGCETNLNQSPAHCGTCGRSCLGGACEAKVCQPLVLADELEFPIAIALNSSTVHWVNYRPLGHIMSSPKTGGGATRHAYDEYPVDIAADDNRVCWASIGDANAPSLTRNVWCRDNIRGVLNLYRLVDNSSQYGLGSIAIDSTWVYFVRSNNAAPATTEVLKVPVMAGVTTAVTLPTSGFLPYLEVDQTHVYFTGDARGFQRAPVTATNASPQSITLGDGSRFDIYSGHIYYAKGGPSGGIERIALDGSSPTLLVPQADLTINGIAVDASGIYYTVNTQLNRAPLNGGQPVVLLGSMNYANDVALDSDAVYWLDGGASLTSPNGVAYKLAK